MTTVAPVVSFHDYTLFDTYRTGLESISSIGTDAMLTVPRTTREEEDMNMLIEIDQARWQEEDAELKEKRAQHVALIEQQQKESQQSLQSKQDLFAREYGLVKQIEDSRDEPRLYDYTMEDVIEAAATHCEWLLDQDIDVPIMNNTNHLLRHNVEYELLTQDKRSAKIVSLHDRFTELALREGNTPALIAKTYATTQDPSHDQLLLKCAEPKKRGRTSDADRLKIPNAVDALRKEYITPRKAIEPPLTNVEMAIEAANTDKYKVFMATLRLVHENALTSDNYGAYIDKINRLIEMKGIDWPMQSLMRDIANMEALLGLTETEMTGLEENEIYYCSCSGDRIKDGDLLYVIRILLYSHERHQKWRILKNKPSREFESPEFMDSVRVYFVKKQFISLTGLWLRDFSDEYKSHYPDHFMPSKRAKHEQKNTVAVNKESHVWQRVNHMRELIHQHHLENRIVKGKTFSGEMTRINGLLQNITDQHSLQTNLQAMIEPYCSSQSSEENTAIANQLMYAILDFLDVLFTVTCATGSLGTRDIEDTTLRLLLDLSIQRGRHATYDATSNEFKKLEGTKGELKQHRLFNENNFLFVALFDYFFPIPVVKSDPDEAEILQLLGM